MAERIAYLNEKYGADIRLLNTPNVDISSTDIRALLKEHVNVSDILPDSVYEYILENNLFGDD